MTISILQVCYNSGYWGIFLRTSILQEMYQRNDCVVSKNTQKKDVLCDSSQPLERGRFVTEPLGSSVAPRASWSAHLGSVRHCVCTPTDSQICDVLEKCARSASSNTHLNGILTSQTIGFLN